VALLVLLAISHLPSSISAQTVLTADGLAAFGTNAVAGGGGGGGCSPSYAKTGGTGNRTTIITVTGDYFGVGKHKTVDGDTVNNGQFFFPGTTVAGTAIIWDFGSGNSVQITESKYYQQFSASQGTWKWQGSNDGSSWSDIGGNFTLDGSTSGTALTTLSGNTTSYRYYRLLGVSGNSNSGPWCYEFEFKICGLP
jgi:hypothetical protein